jgi:hypothetical protein
LVDESGDHKYFTIVPNYILNHSSAIDQALYLQIKRMAGDKGECYLSKKTLKKKLSIAHRTLEKSLTYLIEHKWITFSRTIIVDTPGGPQKVSAYVINDLWKMNVDYFEGCSESDPLSSKGVPDTTLKGVPKGGSNGNTIKNYSNQELTLIKNTEATQSVAEEINPLIELFKEVNPSYEKLYKNKTQRACLERLIKKHKYEQVERVIKVLSSTNGKQFAPVITTPLQLEDNLGKLAVYLKRNNSPKTIKV